jgi:hypothetical protein
MSIMRQSKTKLTKTVLAEYKRLAKHPYTKYILVAGLLILVAGVGLAYRASKTSNFKPVHLSAAEIVAPSTDSCVGSDTRYQNTYSCYKTELTGIINQHNPESATAFLKQQYNNVPYIKSDCHQLMHVVGRAAYAKYGNLAAAFAHGDQYCWSGYYHGIMEQVSREKGINYISDHAATICQPIAKQYGEGSFNH